MSGVILATAIGSGVTAAGGTAAVVAAGIGAGTTLYGGAKSFSDANKARKRADKAARDAKESMADARRRLEVNYMEQLSIMKEPYELARQNILTQGAAGMQAAMEGEERGAAATAGRIQMAVQAREADVRTAMGQELLGIEKMVAEEDANLMRMQATLDLEESEGAQLAQREADVARAQAIQQGFGTLGNTAQGLSSYYAEGGFGALGKEDMMTGEMRRSARQSEGVMDPDTRFGQRQMREGEQQVAQGMQEASDLSGFGFETDFGAVGMEPDAYVPPGMSRQELRQVRGAERQEQQRRADVNRQVMADRAGMDPTSFGPFVPRDQTFNPNSATPRGQYTPPGTPLSDRQTERLLGQQARLGRQEARDIQRAIRQNPGLLRYEPGGGGTSGPLDPFDPFGGAGFTPPSFDNAPRGEAAASVAPAGLGGEPAAAPPPERRPVPPRDSVTSSSENAARGRLAENLRQNSGLEGAELAKAIESIEVERGDDGKFTATYTPVTKQQAEMQVQSESARELLDRLAEGAPKQIVAPAPSPQEVEKVSTKAVQSAAEVGPATEEIVQRVTENVDPDNPLPIAMQWLGVRELDPEGIDLRSELWSTIHGSQADTTGMVDEVWAWCAAFVNHTLAEVGADTLVTDDPYDKGRAKAYETFGKSVQGSNTKEMLGNAKEGDIVVKKKMVPELDKNGKPTGRMKAQYHVGFFSGYDAETGTVNLLGGNQNDEVNITAYPIDQVTAVRRIRVADISTEDREAMSKVMIQQEGGTR